MTVRVARDGEIAVVTIDNPPVNALSGAVRLELLRTAEALDVDPAVAGVVLTGAGKVFVAGADITEFDRPVEEPALPAVIAVIERATKPWVAALNGVAFGGGLELALGCHARIATPATRLALPETGLGIVPGAGGTQRLPRLIGIAEALPVAAEGRQLAAGEAVRLGLVERVEDGDLLGAAVAQARAMVGQPLPPPAGERPLEPPPEGFWAEAEARIARQARGNTAPLRALEAVRHGAELGFAEGLANERKTFLELRQTEAAAALRYLFFAERAAPRPAFLRGVEAVPVASAGVVGGGTMGVGIAAALRNGGLPVTLVERDGPSLAKAMAALEAIYDSAVRRGSLSADAAADRLAGIAGSTDVAALAGADLVIEAVFEDLAVKQEVFARLGSACRPDAILATNTSYLDPRRIAELVDHKERFLGLHFFSPAQVMRLLEIVPTEATRPDVLAAGFALAARLGKIPVRAGICDGFIGNRILRRYRAEAEALLRGGIAIEAIDAAMREFGFAMGPFEMQDLAGLDISHMMREAARARGEAVPETPGDLLVRAGRKGQKTGAGWYDYAPGDRTPRPSAEVTRLLAPMTGPPATLPPETINERMLAAMAAEGKAILAEGIAASASDIDLVEVHGYGFPRWRGGPMFLAGRTGG